MKIIGETKDGLLIDAKRDEVARLIGYYFSGGDCPPIVAGMEIKVNEMYHKLYKMQHLEKEFADMASQLETAAHTLRLQSPIGEVLA